jgi:ERCC4-related helicase
MIFSQYRDSVEEITACLHAFKPLIKVMEFVGQAGTKGNLLSLYNQDLVSQKLIVVV